MHTALAILLKSKKPLPVTVVAQAIAKMVMRAKAILITFRMTPFSCNRTPLSNPDLYDSQNFSSSTHAASSLCPTLPLKTLPSISFAPLQLGIGRPILSKGSRGRDLHRNFSIVDIQLRTCIFLRYLDPAESGIPYRAFTRSSKRTAKRVPARPICLFCVICGATPDTIAGINVRLL